MSSARPKKPDPPSSGNANDGVEGQAVRDGLLVLVLAGVLGYLAWRWGGGQHLVAMKLASFEAAGRSALAAVLKVVCLSAALAVGVAVVVARRAWQRRIARRILKVFAEMGIATRKGEPPKLKSFRREGPHAFVLAFRMPATVSSTLMARIQPNLQEHLDIGVKVWADRGLMWMRVGTRKMPDRIAYRDFRREVNDDVASD